ncbi:MAG: hypothetical protein HQ490_05030, partial [Lutibacter sp.]|nr:hypothetical protein [Lutibacter sp.]
MDIFITKWIYRKTDKFFSYNSSFLSDILVKIYSQILNNFDLIHLHWVGHGFMSSNFLLNIKHEKLIITFHDFYFVTGGCHVPGDCSNYLRVCSNCPAKSYIGDFQLKNFNQKKVLFQSKKIFAIAPSEIMASKLRGSSLGSLLYDIKIIPNPIDISLFKPLKSDFYNDSVFLKLPKDKPCLLFVANNLVDYNKGL